MRSTCIQHPTREPLLILRQWQLDFCESNHCAAALLSQFEYWHNLRLDLSEQAQPANAAARKHGQPAPHEESLFQFHTDAQLQAGLLDLYGTKKIREARHLLVEKGVITEHSNPNPRYAFDKTLYFEFHPEVINAWLDQRRNLARTEPGHPPPDKKATSGNSSNNNVTSSQNAERVGKNAERVGKNADSYTETTYETTTETTTTTPNPSSFTERAAEPKTARGGGNQDQTPKDWNGNHGKAALEPSAEKPVASEKAIDGQRPELAFPAKLTAREHEDIAAQAHPLPTEVAQQMLDVIQARIQNGPPIRTNPAAVFRGIVRKYQVDPSNFDPSSGFHIAEARQRRAEAETRFRIALEPRGPVPAPLPLPARENRPKGRPEGLQKLLQAVSPLLARPARQSG